jgi:hypothetical protein
VLARPANGRRVVTIKQRLIEPAHLVGFGRHTIFYIFMSCATATIVVLDSL